MANVSYDCSKKINVYKQITDYSCAATCACMCIKQSPRSLQSEFDLDWADWDGIAAHGGMSNNFGTDSLSGVIDVLASGYPAIVKVNNSNDHWVVVTKFNGNDSSPVAANFTCADPWTGSTKSLSSATRYKDIYAVQYFS